MYSQIFIYCIVLLCMGISYISVCQWQHDRSVADRQARAEYELQQKYCINNDTVNKSSNENNSGDRLCLSSPTSHPLPCNHTMEIVIYTSIDIIFSVRSIKWCMYVNIRRPYGCACGCGRVFVNSVLYIVRYDTPFPFMLHYWDVFGRFICFLLCRFLLILLFLIVRGQKNDRQQGENERWRDRETEKGDQGEKWGMTTRNFGAHTRECTIIYMGHSISGESTRNVIETSSISILEINAAYVAAMLVNMLNTSTRAQRENEVVMYSSSIVYNILYIYIYSTQKNV